MLKDRIRDEALGEALPPMSRTSGSTCATFRTQSPRFTDIAGLRDLIAHEYFRIDIHRVLEIVERDLPPLKLLCGGENDLAAAERE